MIHQIYLAYNIQIFMKNIFLLAMIALFLGACNKGGNDEPDPYNPEPLPDNNSLEVFYNQYCFGYKVNDTTSLRVLGLSELDGFIYLTGTRKGKLWIGRFDWETKAQLYEFVDTEDFKTEIQYHIGYGEYINVVIDGIQLLRFMEGGDYMIIKLWYDTRASNPAAGVVLGFLYFINDKSDNRYFSYTNDSNGGTNLHKWYNDSYLDIIDQDSGYLISCLNQYGEIIFKGRANFLSIDSYPIDYDIFISSRTVLEFNIETNKNEWCIQLDSRSFTYPMATTEYNWACNLFLFNDYDSKYSYDVVNKSHNIWTFQIDITDYSGYKHSHIAEINIETGELISLK